MILRPLLTALLIAALPFMAVAQESDESAPNTLEKQYFQLKDESNNYQVYKVVKEVKMDAFWSSVADTLKQTGKEISSLKSEVKELKSEVASLESGVAERDSSLKQQAHLIEHMSFMGMDMTKSGYSTFTWSIILVLIIAVLVLYFRYNSANKVTRSTRKDYDVLQEEFEEHKKRSREKETKLKRDLQTEINRIEELKTKFGEA